MSKQYAIALEHDASYAAEDFLRNDALNHCMVSLAQHSAWQEPCTLLIGPEGCGKTHMLHAIAAQTDAVFLSLHEDNATPLESLFTAGSLHIVDDALGHIPERLAQAINHARADGQALLLTMHRHPKQADIALPDLRSRLCAMQALYYPNADDALLEAVMAKRFSDVQWRVSHEVVRYLVQRLPRSFGALHAFIQHADKRAMQAGRALTLPFARELLSDFDGEAYDA